MPSYKVKVGTVQLAGGKVAKAGESVEVSEEEARAHPDVYELGGDEDKRLVPDDGTEPDKVDERTKRVRAEAIRYEAGTLPPPPEQRPEPGTDAGAAQTAQRIQTEQRRTETENAGVFGRLRHPRRGGGGETPPEGGAGGGGGGA